MSLLFQNVVWVLYLVLNEGVGSVEMTCCNIISQIMCLGFNIQTVVWYSISPADGRLLGVFCLLNPNSLESVCMARHFVSFIYICLF